MIWPIGMTEVFDARIAAGGREAFNLGEQVLLQLEIFRRRFDHPVRAWDARFERGNDFNAGERIARPVRTVEICRDALQDRVARVRERIGDPHRMARAGENLRDAMAHEAAAKDRDALVSCRHPAVYPPSA